MPDCATTAPKTKTPMSRKRGKALRTRLTRSLLKNCFPLLSRALALCPRLLAHGLARLASWIIWSLPNERKLLRTNLTIAFPKKTSSQRARIARASVSHLIYASFAFARAARDPSRILELMTYDEEKLAAFQNAGGAILISPHLGHWEVGHLAVNLLGMQTVTVSRKHRYDEVENFLKTARTCTGAQMVYQAGAVRGMLKGLRAGHKIFILVDQNIRPRDGGVYAPFFGLPATVSRAPASLAAKAAGGVWLGACLLEPDGKFRLTCRKIDLLGSESDEAAMAQVNSATEAIVREFPEQYLWWYKRWLFIPDEADTADYPYYARTIRNSAGSITSTQRTMKP